MKYCVIFFLFIYLCITPTFSFTYAQRVIPSGIDNPTNTPGPGTPTVVPTVTPTFAPAGDPPVGDHSGASNEACSTWGYAFDPDAPNQSLGIEIYKDAPYGSTALYRTTTANIPTQWINDFFGIPGNHGFGIQLFQQDLASDGLPHTYYAYAIDTDGTRNLLPNSPVTLTCSSSILDFNVYKDVDRSGSVTGQDVPLGGKTVYISQGSNNPPNPPFDSRTTNGDGYNNFNSLVNQQYTLSYTATPGYHVLPAESSSSIRLLNTASCVIRIMTPSGLVTSPNGYTIDPFTGQIRCYTQFLEALPSKPTITPNPPSVSCTGTNPTVTFTYDVDNYSTWFAIYDINGNNSTFSDGGPHTPTPYRSAPPPPATFSKTYTPANVGELHQYDVQSFYDVSTGLYSNTTSAPITLPNCTPPTPTPTPAPTYIIHVITFKDVNKDGIYNGGDLPWPNQSVSISGPNLPPGMQNPAALTSEAGYTNFQPLTAGTYTLSYTSLPAGFRMSPGTNAIQTISVPTANPPLPPDGVVYFGIAVPPDPIITTDPPTQACIGNNPGVSFDYFSSVDTPWYGVWDLLLDTNGNEISRTFVKGGPETHYDALYLPTQKGEIHQYDVRAYFDPAIDTLYSETLSTPVTLQDCYYRITGSVYEDNDRNQSKNLPIDSNYTAQPGATIDLYGAARSTRTTFSNGGYIFPSLLYGNYSTLLTVPPCYAPTTSVQKDYIPLSGVTLNENFGIVRIYDIAANPTCTPPGPTATATPTTPPGVTPPTATPTGKSCQVSTCNPCSGPNCQTCVGSDCVNPADGTCVGSDCNPLCQPVRSCNPTPTPTAKPTTPPGVTPPTATPTPQTGCTGPNPGPECVVCNSSNYASCVGCRVGIDCPVPPTPTPLVSVLSGSMVFVDQDKSGSYNSGDAPLSNVQVVLTGTLTYGNPAFTPQSTNTIANGTYSFPNPATSYLYAGTYTVTLTNPSPSRYEPSTATQGTVTLPPSIPGPSFGLIPKYKISGNIFDDYSKNGTKDAGEPGMPGLQIRINGPVTQTVTTDSSGNYTTVTPLYEGQYTVTLISNIPAGYRMTNPSNTVGYPSFTVTVGRNCTPSANCQTAGFPFTASDIGNLNFGMTNCNPWFQLVGNSARVNGNMSNGSFSTTGFSDPVPDASGTQTCGGSYAATGNSLTTPGIIFSNGTATFGQGQASAYLNGSTPPYNWKANEAYPVKHTSTSYGYMVATLRQSGITPKPIPAACLTSGGCSLDNLNGIYQSDTTGTVTITTSNLQANRQIVLLIKGDLYINGNIILATCTNLTLSVAGDIHVDKTVGNADGDFTTTTAHITGFFSTDQSFIIDGSNNSCGLSATPDKRLNIGGSVVVNAAETGGIFQNKRDLGINNKSCPAFTIVARPDMLLCAPDFIKKKSDVWREVAP